MTGGADDLSMFCEQCGAHRDQTVREAALETCARCGKSVCPNCWNLTAGACLACVPFALPITIEDEPAPAPVRSPDPVATPAAVIAAAPTRRPSVPRRRTPGIAVRGPRRPRPSRPSSRAVVRLGIATVAGSFVATVAVAFILASWAGHGGAAVVDAGAAMTPPPVAPAAATPSPTPTPRATARPRATHRLTVEATPKPRPRPTARPTRKPTPKPPALVAFLSCSVSDLTVVCTGDASRSGATFAWTFGDGSSGTGESASHTYAEPGMYHVDLTVKVGGAKASDSTTAKVIAP